MTNYPKLQAIFPEIDFENIQEHHIIKLSSNVFRDKFAPTLKDVCAEEILELIKSKEWNWTWHLNPVRGECILFYPIHYNAFDIVRYLLENKKYDISKYDPIVSKGLTECVARGNREMMDYLLSQNMHPDYIADLTVRTYLKAESTPSALPLTKKYYGDQGTFLMSQNPNFEHMIFKMINEERDFLKDKDLLIKLIENHPAPLVDKLNMIENVLNDDSIPDYRVAEFKSVKDVVNNWRSYNHLQEILPQATKTNKKSKI